MILSFSKYPSGCLMYTSSSSVTLAGSYFRTQHAYLLFLPFSANTFFTIFCSSTKNALTILCLTQFAHLDPPYARATVFSLFLQFLNSGLLMCLIPGKEILQSPHTAPFLLFFIYWPAYLPPVNLRKGI